MHWVPSECHYEGTGGGDLAHIQTLDVSGNSTGHTWYEYDEAARLVSAENGDAWVGFEYNASGQITKETLNAQALSQSYNEADIRNQLHGANTPLDLLWQQGQLQQLSIGAHQPVDFSHNEADFETQRGNQQGFSLHQKLGYLNENTLHNETPCECSDKGSH
ncbi:hypothetical protein [Vibrio scophthalmi]|uniref:YD repeat protein n=1 Tax=Vibrio scophthalmi LMG 19158 TaxID=870967 RepID=F9RS93_9VIBR|nr:hypothetical protein [Vibrio scophthalmi]EGU32419.1 YD repeat protein [Vibrio scophthalmi LMG 19158]